jgi:hypothetical protein
MPSANAYGNCHACSAELKKTQYGIALQHHTIAYTLEGETPDDQAYLEISSMATVASFCSNACCKSKLTAVLLLNGIAKDCEQTHIFGGPVHPCAKCDAMVNLTQPHGAWVKLKRTVEDVDGEPTGYPEWFDVHAVICAGCAGLEHGAEVAKRTRRRRTAALE